MKAKGDNKNEKDFFNSVADCDVHISGSKVDDEQENIISEDEENKFYGLRCEDPIDPDKYKRGRKVHKHPALFMLIIA